MTLGVKTEKEHVYERTQHRALYHAVSKQRWSVFQKRELGVWQQDQALQQRQAFVKQYFLPRLIPLFEGQTSEHTLLEIGCGPVCVGQFLGDSQNTYVDPLIDDYKRLFPGVLPEKSTFIAAMIEEVNLQENAFDRVLCLNSLSDVHNPELLLHKVTQVLKPNGYFVISIDLWPSLLAKGHCFLSRFAPGLPRLNRLYSYTRQGFANTLSRHFHIVSVHRIQTKLHWLSFRQEWFFICQLPDKKRDAANET